MSRELMPKSGIMMPHVVVNRDAAVVGVSTVDGVAGAIDLTDKYLQKTDAAATYQTKTEGASKTYVLDSIQPIMEGALFKADPFVDNNIPFRSAGSNGVESVDMIKVTPENSIKLGSYESSVQGVEIHSAGRVVVVDKNDSGVETKYPVYSKRFRPEIEDLPFAAIGSYVKDSQGRTIGVNRTGINSDIKQFTQKVTFQQPVTIADGVGDYDAVTMRQLRNSGGGSGGPTMSGISNYGIGDFHLRDSRAFIPAFEVVSDGQLLNRDDYPDLWAYAQLLTPIEDSLWLEDSSQRGRYSTGDGTTTFRVPDRNGVQSGSIKALFARGDGGVSSDAGIIRQAHIPNIVGNIVLHGAGSANIFSNGTGVFTPGGGNPTAYRTPADLSSNSGAESFGTMGFSAASSNNVFGRYPTLTDDVLPKHFTGVWTIRAHGGFVAANTSWSVINGDATMPPTTTSVTGGRVISEYRVGSQLEGSADFRMVGTIGSTYSARVSVHNATLGVTRDFDFGSDGCLTTTFLAVNTTGNSPVDITGQSYSTINVVDITNSSDIVGRMWRIGLNGVGGFNFIGRKRNDSTTGQIVINLPASSGTLALQGTSGIAYKKDIKNASPKEAFDRISNQRLVNFVYKDDEQERVRFGVIAEEAEIVAPQYIKHNQEPYEDILDGDGNKIGEKKQDRPSIDTNPIVMDLIGAVHYLRDEVDQLKAELSELKSSK